jgi:hypothetical protein
MIDRATRKPRWAKSVRAALAVLGLALATAGGASATTGTGPVHASGQQATLLGASHSFKTWGFQVRPEILPLSGDGTVFVGGPGWKTRGRRILNFGAVEWTSFGGSEATGIGLLWLNNCTPDCAEGSFRHYSATVTATVVHKGHYTRLKVESIVGKRHVNDVYGLYEAGSRSSWDPRTP